MEGPGERGLVRLACAAMGTRFEVVLHDGDPVQLRAAGEAALDEVLLWHSRLTAFEASSVVSAINRSGGEWWRVDAETLRLLVLCREMWERTGGAFDPTVGGLMRAWGLRGGGCDMAEVERARECTGMQLVELDPARGRVRLLREGVRLDLGAIGKGWALDRAAEVLRDGGVGHALMHGGTSSVVAMGRAPDGRAWRVALGEDAGAPRCELSDAALGVSAHHGRSAVAAGVERGHVVDPVTGRPEVLVGARARAAAVVATSAAVADALSTAALLRPELAGEWANEEGVRSVAVSRRRDGQCRWEVAGDTRVIRANVELLHV